MSTAAGYAIIPHLSIVTDVEGLKQLPEVVFELEIPQIMSVMSALVFSIMIGLAAAWNKSKMITGVLEEFQAIVLSIVSKVIIPVLPFFIALTFCSLAYEGSITKQLPVFLQVIVIVLIGHFIWMALLYILAGNLFTRKSHGRGALLRSCLSDCSGNHVLGSYPCRCPSMCRKSKTTSERYGTVWHSSFCQYPSLRFCSHRSIFLYDSIQNFVRLPSVCRHYDPFLSSSGRVCHRRSRCPRRNRYGVSRNHHRGSWLQRNRHSPYAYHFCPSGQFFGTACNVTGDGALTLFLTGYAKRHHIQEQNIHVRSLIRIYKQKLQKSVSFLRRNALQFLLFSLYSPVKSFFSFVRKQYPNFQFRFFHRLYL